MQTKSIIIDKLSSKSAVIADIMGGYENDDERKMEMYDVLAYNVECLGEIADDGYRFWGNPLENMFKIIEFLYQYDLSNKIGIINAMRDEVVIGPDVVVPDTTTIREVMSMGCWREMRPCCSGGAIFLDHMLCFIASCNRRSSRLYLDNNYAINACIVHGAGNILKYLHERDSDAFRGKYGDIMEQMEKFIRNEDYIRFCLDIDIFARVDRSCDVTGLMRAAISSKNMIIIRGLVANGFRWCYAGILYDCANEMEMLEILFSGTGQVEQNRGLNRTIETRNVQTCKYFCERMDKIDIKSLVKFCNNVMVNDLEIMEMMAKKVVFLRGPIELYNDGHENYPLVRCIINRNAEIETIYYLAKLANNEERNNGLFFVVHMARYNPSAKTKEIMLALLRSGANPNYTMPYYGTMVGHAIIHNSLWVTETLILNGANNVDLRNHFGRSTLEIAYEHRIKGRTLELIQSVSKEYNSCSCVVQ